MIPKTNFGPLHAQAPMPLIHANMQAQGINYRKIEKGKKKLLIKGVLVDFNYIVYYFCVPVRRKKG